MPKKQKQESKEKVKQVNDTVFEDEKTRNERLKKILIQKREAIVKEAQAEIKKFKSGEKKQLVEAVMDDGDMSVVDLAEDISLRQLSSHRDVLLKIDAALRKLKENTYGVCEECGDEINEERLKILPFAIHCLDCQEKMEAIEKMKREEG